jgi:ABC-2 type transport system permease protein
MTGLLSPALNGTVRYEVTMALRRRVSWLSLLPLCLLALLIGLGAPGLTGIADPVARIGESALMLNLLGTIGIAMALADRLDAQRRPGLHELVTATPAGRSARLAGVLLGPWLVALLPVALVLLVLAVAVAVPAGTATPLAAALLGLLSIVVPGSLLLTVAANLLGVLLPVPAVRVLVVPLWYWATALSPLLPLPTVAGTVLSPLGAYQAAAWLGTSRPAGPDGWLRPPVGSGAAVLSIAITLGATFVLFLIARAVAGARR